MKRASRRVSLSLLNLFLCMNLCAQQLDSGGTSTATPSAAFPSGVEMAAHATGAVPRLIKFNGKIASHIAATQTAQNDVQQGGQSRLIGATFSLYALQDDGHPLWSESQQIELDGKGQYTVLLGATEPEGLPL